MKLLKIFFIFSSLFSFINPTCLTEVVDSYRYRNYDDCIKRTFSSKEIEDRAYKCCYVEIVFKIENTKLEVHGCAPLTKSQYKNIDQAERTIKMETYVEDVKIECKS